MDLIRRLSVFALAFALVFYMVSVEFYAVSPEGRVIRVPQHYTTIQEAIDAANPGDMVYVSAGTYNESVYIGKSLSLVGDCRSTTVIDSASVWVNASRVLVSNFTIKALLHLGPPEGSEYVWLKNISRCLIANNTIHGGIKLNFCSHSIIVNNSVISCGILLADSSDNIIIHNHVTYPGPEWAGTMGIYLYSGWRLQGFVSDRNVIAYNNITDCGYMGMFIFSSDGNVIVGNNITNNGWSSPGDGLHLWVWPENHNFIYHNNFVNNTKHHASLLFNRADNTWDDGYPSGGNYYDNYTGADVFTGPYQNETGSDGIGDTPYIIPYIVDNGDAINVDRYPIMNPYTPVTSMIIEPLRTLVGQGFTAPINTALTNLSPDTETFTVTLKANNARILTQTVTLQGGATTNMCFAWNTTGVLIGTYAITTTTTTASGRTDTHFAFPRYIRVTIPGDVDADFDVDIYDVVKICAAYASNKGEPAYAPTCDINQDDKINIYDAVIACARYGQKQT